MLTYRISARDIKRDVQAINLNSRLVEIDDDTINISASNSGVKKDDYVTFVRDEGDYIHFNEDVPVLSVSNGSLSVSKFAERLLPIYNAGVSEMNFHPYKSKRKFLVFLLTGGEHDFVQYRHDDRYSAYTTYIREYIYGDYSEYVKKMKRCDNDFVLYEDTFLYKATVDTETGKYSFEGADDNTPIANTVENTKAFIYIEPSEELAAYISEHSTGGDSWYVMADERICLTNCVIPVDKNGRNDRTAILWEVRDSELASKIAENAKISTFSAEDVRFIVRDNYQHKTGIFSLTNGTFLQRVSYSAIFSEPVLQDIGTNLFQEDAIKTKYIDNVIEKLKNGTIDYEKKCFTPVYYDGNGTKDVEEIRFNLHFRERPVTEAENSAGYTYGDWKIADNLLWNNYTKNGAKLEPKSGLTDNDADLLGYLGFTDEDVIRERNRIGRSFLRVSFYDTPDRRTQSLLFTSTLFMNTGEYYEQYSTNVRGGVPKNGKPKDVKTIENQYVYTETAVPRLSSTFSCKDKYSTTSSSEGFYLYLFPGLLDEDGRGTIYMKAEFNHAKYGYTIPFIMPVDSDNNPISTGSEDFPIRYVTADTNGNQYIDTPRLFNDMYIKVNIEYDSNKKRYIWYIPNNIWNATPSLNLFEPRINAGEDFIVYIGKTGVIAASGDTINGALYCGHEQTWAVELTPEDGWSITPDHGVGSSMFVIRIPENLDASSDDNKEFEAVFTCGNEQYSVTFSQLPPNYEFSVEPTDITFEWEGGSESFRIEDENNYGWRISIPQFISSITERSGTGSTTIEISAEQNEIEAVKSGTIVVQDTRYNKPNEISVTQYYLDSVWGFVESADFGDAELNVSWRNNIGCLQLYDEDDLGYEMVTNIDSYKWLHLNVTPEWYGGYLFTFEFDENFEREERQANITIRDKKYGIKYRTIYITQDASERGNVILDIDPAQVSVDCDWMNGGVYVYMEYAGGDVLLQEDYTISGTDDLYAHPNHFYFSPDNQGTQINIRYSILFDIQRSDTWGNTDTVSLDTDVEYNLAIPFGYEDDMYHSRYLRLQPPHVTVDRNNNITIGEWRVIE